MAKRTSTQHLDNMIAEDAERYVSSFTIHLQAENKRDSTIAHYIGALRQFIMFAMAEGLPPLTETRTGQVQLWLARLRSEPTKRTGKPYAEASIRNRYLGLRVFFDWLAREGDIKRNPFGPVNERFIRPPEMDESPKDIVSPEEMARVFAHLEKHDRWRDAAAIAILYDCGLRASELASLRSESIDLKTGFIQLGAANSPTKGRRPRIVRLSPKGVAMLDRYWRRVKRRSPEFAINGNGGGHSALGGQITRAGVYGIPKRAFAELNIQATIGAHDLRHTSASHAAMGGLNESDAMALYGWRDPTMWRHYSEQVRQQAALAAHVSVSPLERLPKR